ncbi:hypothetical protein IIC38_14245 [candidate division KSB1 bacterium]|nr:hypothetical protein [candidate division KSB1 bacterium]
MIIRLTKGNNKPDTLTCVRTDGSTTWTNLHPNMFQHDLMHYAVETTLGLQNSFFGQVASGIDISEFNKPTNQRGFEIPVEAIQTEYIVGLLQVELSDGAVFEDFNDQLQKSLANKNIPIPEQLTEAALDDIRTKFKQLLRQWAALQPGDYLKLTFLE